MAFISSTMTSHLYPFHRSDAFQSYAMSSFPLPAGRHMQHDGLSRDSPTLPASAPPRPVVLPPLSSINPTQQRPCPPPLPPDPPYQFQQLAFPEHIPQYAAFLPSMSPRYGSQVTASSHYGRGRPLSIAAASLGARFPIAPTSDPNSLISAGRHKKEVKKRTKTGCMTCRKRRIKCDEGHPACRNCVKSKRECLGYDPVFKSQSPSSIRPAPHLRSPASPNTPLHLRPPSYPFSSPLSRPSSSATDASPASLDHADFPPRSHELQLGRSNSVAPSADTMSNPDKRGEAREPPRPEDQTIRRATQTSIDNLCSIEDPSGAPVAAASHHELPNNEALRAIYSTSFAPGLDRLLETRWFSAEGYVSLSADRSLLVQFENYVAALADSPSVATKEARLVWALLCTCRRRPLPGFAGEFLNDKDDTLDGDDVAEKRLDVLEALITGRKLPSNPLAGGPESPVPAHPPSLAQQLQARQQTFWLHVGDFVSTSTSTSPSDAVERILSKSRKLLDNLENRDVIYSVMLMRHIGEKWPDKQIGEASDERDRKDWLAAKGFLESEAEGKAMNIAVQRFCSMALRAWSL